MPAASQSDQCTFLRTTKNAMRGGEYNGASGLGAGASRLLAAAGLQREPVRSSRCECGSLPAPSCSPASSAARNRRPTPLDDPDAADARRVQGGGSRGARRDRRARARARARQRQRHRVGRRRGLGRSRSARAGHRRHPLPRRLDQQEFRRAGAGAALRRRQARPRRVRSPTWCRKWRSTIRGRPTAPVTVRQLLEHTAGFDDMHFNESLRPRRRHPTCRSSRCCSAIRRRGGCGGSRARGCRTPIPATASPGSSSRRSRASPSTTTSKQRIFRRSR